MHYLSPKISNHIFALLLILLTGLLFGFIDKYFEIPGSFQVWFFTVSIIVISMIAILFTLYKVKKIGVNGLTQFLCSVLAGGVSVTLGLGIMWYWLFYNGGEVEFYIPQWVCSNDAQRVIREFDIQKVHSCETENTIFRNRKAKLISIEYNLAACFQKCVYSFRQAIIQDGQVFRVTSTPD